MEQELYDPNLTKNIIPDVLALQMNFGLIKLVPILKANKH